MSEQLELLGKVARGEPHTRAEGSAHLCELLDITPEQLRVARLIQRDFPECGAKIWSDNWTLDQCVAEGMKSLQKDWPHIEASTIPKYREKVARYCAGRGYTQIASALRRGDLPLEWAKPTLWALQEEREFQRPTIPHPTWPKDSLK